MDLKKLQGLTGCDLMSRYKNLLQYYKENNFVEEAQWTANLLKKIKQREREQQEEEEEY